MKPKEIRQFRRKTTMASLTAQIGRSCDVCGQAMVKPCYHLGKYMCTKCALGGNAPAKDG